MKNRVSWVLLLVVFLTAGCAVGYEDGKSPQDVPAYISVINLKDVYMPGGKDDASGNPGHDPNPSKNDQEVLVLAKANIISQFVNYGYKIVEGDAPADICTKFFVYYMPERWPLVDRSVNIQGRFFTPAGIPLFHVRAYKANSAGLIGWAVGPSRDDMVAQAAREAVVDGVDEMRKGTFTNETATELLKPLPDAIGRTP